MIVTAEGTIPNPTNITKIPGWPKPKNAKQVKQLIAIGHTIEGTYKKRKRKKSEACENPSKFLRSH